MRFLLVLDQLSQRSQVEVQVLASQTEDVLELLHSLGQRLEGAAESLLLLRGQRPRIDTPQRLALHELPQELDHGEHELGEPLLERLRIGGDPLSLGRRGERFGARPGGWEMAGHLRAPASTAAISSARSTCTRSMSAAAKVTCPRITTPFPSTRSNMSTRLTWWGWSTRSRAGSELTTRPPRLPERSCKAATARCGAAPSRVEQTSAPAPRPPDGTCQWSRAR